MSDTTRERVVARGDAWEIVVLERVRIARAEGAAVFGALEPVEVLLREPGGTTRLPLA